MCSEAGGAILRQRKAEIVKETSSPQHHSVGVSLGPPVNLWAMESFSVCLADPNACPLREGWLIRNERNDLCLIYRLFQYEWFYNKRSCLYEHTTLIYLL